MNQPPHNAPPQHHPPQQQAPPQHHSPQQPEPPRKTPTRAIIGFIIAIVGFVGGIIPLVGFIGIAGLLIGVLELSVKDPKHPRGLATASVVLGAIATLGAVLWLALGTYTILTGSCPHVYAFDGDDYTLDGDMVSGALFAGAERDDFDRLEHLRAVDGVYRLRVQNDLDEVDHINRLALLVVDHAPGDEVLPTPGGELVVVRGAQAPRSRAVVTSPHDTWTLSFARPAGDEALLVVRGNNTELAERAFMQYMAKMGHGVGPLFAWMIDDDCPCSRTYLDEETERLGLPLSVEVIAEDGTAHQRQSLGPVGPATLRSQAVRVRLPPGVPGEELTIRLAGTHDFWSVEDVQLAPITNASIAPRTITPRRAIFGADDVTSAITAHDDQRVVLQPGQRIDVEIDAPPVAAEGERTVIVSLNGFYEIEFGGQPGINVAAVIAHQAGWMSLPDLARDMD